MKRKVNVVLIIFLSTILGIVLSRGLIYHLTDYKCSNMARDLEDSLESIGIDVRIMSGYSVDKQEGHIWIKANGLEIDSVWLIPVSNSDIYGYAVREFDDYNDFVSYYKL